MPFGENMIKRLQPSRLDILDLEELSAKNIRVDVLRLDLIHPLISGNKWFKLKYYLVDAISKGYSSILSFGGAYSNHVLATASATNEIGMKSIGIIRGENVNKLSHTLGLAQKLGMHLEFISRTEFKKINDTNFLENLTKRFDNSYIVPEGGAGPLGIKGSKEILMELKENDYTHIICDIGTGTMFQGLKEAANRNQKVIGITVLKGIENEYHNDTRADIIVDYHFGGYAKKNETLLQFMNNFFVRTGIPTDFVYTGKLFFGAMDLIKRNYFLDDSKLLIVHSGGLQGNDSLPKGTLVF
jgi:1-aminocyclopropane-1-carboxylate deaminase